MSSGKNTGRTVLLSLVVLLALAVLIAVAVLVFTDRNGSQDTGTATSVPTTTRTTTSSPPATTTTSETTTEPTTRARPTGEPGTVTYQFTGDGEVVGASYRSGRDMRVVVITGTPWQQKTTVENRRAELTGLVVRGRITCTIMQGEELLASSTSGGGPINCRATLPR